MRIRWIDPSLLNIKGDKATVRRGESETRAAGERSASPPSGLRGNRNHAETTTRTLQNVSAPKFDSKTEAAYFSYLNALKFGGQIVDFWFHPMTLALPGEVSHKPDFLVLVKHGERLQIHEVKGWSKNLRDGMTRFKIASALYYCWEWMLVKQIKGRWELRTA